MRPVLLAEDRSLAVPPSSRMRARTSWEGDAEASGSRVVVVDGHHDTVAAPMLGLEFMPMTWNEEAPAGAIG